MTLFKKNCIESCLRLKFQKIFFKGISRQKRLEMTFSGHLLAIIFTLIQNCHSEVPRGIPLNFALYHDNYFSRVNKTLRSLRLCGEIHNEVIYA
jgi:hypothetical protein